MVRKKLLLPLLLGSLTVSSFQGFAMETPPFSEDKNRRTASVNPAVNHKDLDVDDKKTKNGSSFWKKALIGSAAIASVATMGYGIYYYCYFSSDEDNASYLSCLNDFVSGKIGQGVEMIRAGWSQSELECVVSVGKYNDSLFCSEELSNAAKEYVNAVADINARNRFGCDEEHLMNFCESAGASNFNETVRSNCANGSTAAVSFPSITNSSRLYWKILKTIGQRAVGSFWELCKKQ